MWINEFNVERIQNFISSHFLNNNTMPSHGNTWFLSDVISSGSKVQAHIQTIRKEDKLLPSSGFEANICFHFIERERRVIK